MTDGEFLAWLRLRGSLITRRFGRTCSTSMGRDSDADLVNRIYVINLDRKYDRWMWMRRELTRLKTAAGEPLTSITRRFSAIDARYLTENTAHGEVDNQYSLAEQLFVQPADSLTTRTDLDDRVITMTRQEIAIALSHIEIWRRIAADEARHALVLEDDTYFTQGFARRFDALWQQLVRSAGEDHDFDVLYLSYKLAGSSRVPPTRRQLVFAPTTGLWQLSGYVLSRVGAQRLLELLPVRRPIDLWINHQFQRCASSQPDAQLSGSGPTCHRRTTTPYSQSCRRWAS